MLLKYVQQVFIENAHPVQNSTQRVGRNAGTQREKEKVLLSEMFKQGAGDTILVDQPIISNRNWHIHFSENVLTG